MLPGEIKKKTMRKCVEYTENKWKKVVKKEAGKRGKG